MGFEDLENGMYVRCAFDDESETYPRTFIMGKVIEKQNNFNEVNVQFYDHYGLRNYLPNIPSRKMFRFEDVTRCHIMKNETVQFYSKCKELRKGLILNFFKKREDLFYYYYVLCESQVLIVCETEIEAPLQSARIDPVQQLLQYEFQNPRWYLNRNVVRSFTNILDNSPIGFETLVGARAYLFPHQIDTIMRASRQSPCRLMLADEVGLGKTIEALIIANTLSRTKDNFKTLVIVPTNLMNQWKNEFDIKLWLSAQINDGKREINSKNVIIPLEELTKPEYTSLLNQDWDLAIIDEVHKVIKDEGIYDKIYSLSQRVNNLLILTATPITSRRTEYLNLLKLLKPQIYGDMIAEQFDVLVEKNNKIKEHVCEIRNMLEEYYESNNEDKGLLEDIVGELAEIDEYLDDDYFHNNFDSIDIENEEQSLVGFHTLLGYIAEYYQIDRDIIRHRRVELKNKFSNRTLHKISYMMQDADQNYNEYESYSSLQQYLMELKNEGILNIDIAKELLSRMFSSPYALKAYLTTNTKLISSQKYDELVETVNKYINGLEREIEDPYLYLEDPDFIRSRVTKLLDYLDQEAYDKKVVVFTSYTETAKMLNQLLGNFVGSESLSRFYKGLPEEELTREMNRFQADQNVKIMICDYTAGEGRNLQMADLIVHYDLPISPNEIEQRIGRLDRIGREQEKEVTSVVLYAQDTMEEYLLRIWNEAFNIFGESLSGLEIALEDFEDLIKDFLLDYEDIEFDEVLAELKNKTKELKKVLREERLYDANRQLSRRLQKTIEKLIENVDDNQGESLSNAMGAWGMMVGFRSEKVYLEQNILAKFSAQTFGHGSFKKAWYIPLETSEILKRSKKPNEIVGTFSRELAIKNEALAFFAPGEPIFDSIMKHAITNYRGTCCAMELVGDFEFSGFVFNWKTSFQERYLLDFGLPIENIKYLKGFNLVKKESDLIKISGDEAITIEEIEKLITSTSQSRITHLGQRSGRYSKMDQFVELHSPNRWRRLVIQSRNTSLKNVKQKSTRRLSNIKKQFSKHYKFENRGHIQSRSFYESEQVELKEDERLYKALVKGILNCKYELDSVFYVRVKKHV
ncbi:SNF2-related protein [Niallia taxi]|uniref:SNF2-related protein n=1 Tax=Niallia taxi TaxID=2499688 RepID=UPI002E1BC5B3|nr:SNF2-related protein [Niallia taxi]MED4057765.1 SNF2-related protein [Niallia taxi]MED4122323.1 SNF2-related protein [Niallia taxi]